MVSQSSVNIGGFGVFGFPLVALLYAFVRMAGSSGSTREVAQLREHVAWLEGALEEARGYAEDDGEP